MFINNYFLQLYGQNKNLSLLNL